MLITILNIISGNIIRCNEIPADFNAISSLCSPIFPKVIKEERRIDNGRAIGTKLADDYGVTVGSSISMNTRHGDVSLIDPGDADDLATELKKSLEAPAAYSKKNYEWAMQFSWERLVLRFEALYMELVR